jgi:competence protein ComGC
MNTPSPIQSGRQRAAFTLIELLLVLLGVLILIGLLLPAIMQPEKKFSRINCVNNMKQIGLAFRIWSGDNGDRYPMAVSITNGGTMEAIPQGLAFPHFQVMSNELNTPKIVVCPNDTERTSATNFTADFNDQRVSYFVGVDANETNAASILAGDRNLLINGVAGRRGLVNVWSNMPVAWVSTNLHRSFGNLAMADGSVQQDNSAKLREALASTGLATNRLAIP